MLLLTKVAEVPTPLSVKIMQLFGPTHNYSEIVDSEIHIYIHPPHCVDHHVRDLHHV